MDLVYELQSMNFSKWTLVHGSSRTFVHGLGLQTLVYGLGLWTSIYGLKSMDFNLWTWSIDFSDGLQSMDCMWFMDCGLCISDHGAWTLDLQSMAWMVVHGLGLQIVVHGLGLWTSTYRARG